MLRCRPTPAVETAATNCAKHVLGLSKGTPARAPSPTSGESAQADFVPFIGANSFAGRRGVYR